VDLPEEGLIIGKNNYRGEERFIRQQVKDRRLHTYVIGQTGTGKTQLLKS
jgi:type IV secretory pathway VirB4 component